MRLIKVSPKFQITIPKWCRSVCHTGWLFIEKDGNVIHLREVQIEAATSEQEFLDGLMRENPPKYLRDSGKV